MKKTYVVQGLINNWGQPGHLIGVDARSKEEAVKLATKLLKDHGVQNKHMNRYKYLTIHEP